MSKKALVLDILSIVLGNFVLAAGVVLFIVPNGILTGGVAGVVIAIEPIIHIEPNIMITLLTIALFIIGVIVLGKQFMVKTLLSTILFPLFINLLTIAVHGVSITSDPLLASIYGGVFIGGGLGIVLRTGASTGGMDIPPLIIHKYTHIKLHTLVVLVDGLTVLLGIALHSVEAAMIGLVSVWVSGIMINKAMMIGLRESQSVLIISEYHEQITKHIIDELDRGATLLEAQGTYTKNRRPVLMVVISKKQFPLLNRLVHSVDPGAFVIVQDVNEVHGEGFTFADE